MANDDERRKKFWEDDEEDEGTSRNGQSKSISSNMPSSEDVDRKINEARVLMEQTHQLYLHFFNGIEKRTPVEKLKMLETKINELQRIGTNLTSAKFKVSQFLTQYSTMKELWERKLRDRERK